MIRLEKLTKLYGGTQAVSEFDLEVMKGEFCILIGPSGCGKSTTLRMINKLIPAYSGRILIDGKDTANADPVKLRRDIGYVIQNIGLFPHMTVAKNIGTVPRLLGWDRRRIRDRTGELMEMLDLPSALAGRFPHSLSGGQAQRVGVARALAADPPVLLMDEPFGAVDPVTRDRLQAEFKKLQASLKKTVIMVTHDMDEAVRMADTIAIMREGRLEQYGSVDEILDRPATPFVREFVGRDGSIKKLSRLRVSDWLRPAVSVGAEDSYGNKDIRGWQWVTGRGGKLLGWMDADMRSGGKAAVKTYVEINIVEEGIREDASLREALSRMMGMSERRLPVVDRDGILLGELRFEDVEKALLETGEADG